MGGDAAVSIVVPQALAADPSVAWAARRAQEALGRRDIAARVGPEAGGGTVVEVAGAGVAPSFGDGLARGAPRAWRCCARATGSSPGATTGAASSTR